MDELFLYNHISAQIFNVDNIETKSIDVLGACVIYWKSGT